MVIMCKGLWYLRSYVVDPGDIVKYPMATPINFEGLANCKRNKVKHMGDSTMMLVGAIQIINNSIIISKDWIVSQ